MGKFDGLNKFLEKSNEKKLVLKFDYIKELIGQKLCNSAYKYKEYWQPAGHTLSNLILDSGYKIDFVDLENEIVVLIKID